MLGRDHYLRVDPNDYPCTPASSRKVASTPSEPRARMPFVVPAIKPRLQVVHAERDERQ
jgi:hypothetical protein